MKWGVRQWRHGEGGVVIECWEVLWEVGGEARDEGVHGEWCPCGPAQGAVGVGVIWGEEVAVWVETEVFSVDEGVSVWGVLVDGVCLPVIPDPGMVEAWAGD